MRKELVAFYIAIAIGVAGIVGIGLSGCDGYCDNWVCPAHESTTGASVTACAPPDAGCVCPDAGPNEICICPGQAQGGFGE